MVIALVLSLLYAIFYLYLMAHCVNLLAYVAIVLMHIIFIGGAAGMVYGAYRTQNVGFYVGAGFMVLTVLIFDLILCCYKTQFKMALAIIAAAADFATETKRLIFV